MSAGVQIEVDTRAVTRSLAAYALASRKNLDEVLEKKGRDLGIKLFQGYRARQWGGAARRAGIARSELVARTAAGRGTKIRESILRGFRAEVVTAPKVRDAKSARGKAAARRRRASIWQKYVGREIAARQRGIGVLAASFLWFRKRKASSGNRGIEYVRNRTGRPLGGVEKGADFLRIQGYTAGLGAVGARYGIIRRALLLVQADMDVYLARKQDEAARLSGLRR